MSGHFTDHKITDLISLVKLRIYAFCEVILLVEIQDLCPCPGHFTVFVPIDINRVSLCFPLVLFTDG